MKNTTEKTPSAARLYLKSISKSLQYVSKTTGARVNDLLTRHYTELAACPDWGTFAEWKKKGYFVGKGEKGFAVWSQPRKTKDAGGEDGEKGDEDGEKPAREIFFTAFIFCARQVANREGLKPDGTQYTASGLIPPHCQAAETTPAPAQPAAKKPLLLPAPAQPKATPQPETKQPQPQAAPARVEYVEQLALAI